MTTQPYLDCRNGHADGDRDLAEKFISSAKLKQVKININPNIKSDKSTVPNVVGLPLRDALFVLENKNFKVKYNGMGKVKKQSLPAGSLMRNNTNINLELL